MTMTTVSTQLPLPPSSSDPSTLATGNVSVEEVFIPLHDRVITLREWWTKITQNSSSNSNNNNNNDAPQVDHKLLDVRPLRATKTLKQDSEEKNRPRHRRLCLSSTTSTSRVEVVHIPIDELKDRSFELPARHVKFSLLVLPEDLERVSDFLLYGNHHNKTNSNSNSNSNQIKNKNIDEDEDQEATEQHQQQQQHPRQPKTKKQKKNRQGRKLNPWKVTHVLVDDDKLWDDAMKLGLLEDLDTSKKKNIRDLKDNDTAKQSNENTSFNQDNNNEDEHRPLPRLWQPDSMVQNVLLPLLKESIVNQHRKGKDQSGEAMEVWDLASGSARDVAFLAEELKQHYHSQSSIVDGKNGSHDGCTEEKIVVVGCDHRYNTKERDLVTNFWRRRNVKDYTRPLKIDLSQWSALQQEMSMSKLMAMYCVRFWKIELVTSIASCDQIPKDVLFAISHFCKPSPNAQWNFDHPSEKTVLERTQLSAIFGSQGWTILHDEITTDSDHGRPMINFVARR